MRGKGITYDTGFLSAGTSTRRPFDPDVVRREMRVVAITEFGCTTYRGAAHGGGQDPNFCDDRLGQ